MGSHPALLWCHLGRWRGPVPAAYLIRGLEKGVSYRGCLRRYLRLTSSRGNTP